MKKDRTNQRGQALAYFGIFGLVFFSLAAVAVDVGRHVLRQLRRDGGAAGWRFDPSRCAPTEG